MTDYIALPKYTATVIAAWVAAAYLIDVWDRFPHLAITSPEKRCGKTTLLDLLSLIVPKPLPTSNISPAALYRQIEAMNGPTLLFDEAQSLTRVGSESGVVTRELLNAGIGKNAQVLRCGGKKMDKVLTFHTYSPKVFAAIGKVDGVLADRSLSVSMKRKTQHDKVKRFFYRAVESRAQEIKSELEEWATESRKSAALLYSSLEPFDIDNDRMAELLIPLQCVLSLEHYDEGLEILSQYATSIDERDRREELQTPGVRLLAACREIFDDEETKFIRTSTLISRLIAREEEPWYRWNRGEGMNAESLARLLQQFEIRPKHNKEKTQRGYFSCDFEDAWARYLAPLEKPSNPSIPSSLSRIKP